MFVLLCAPLLSAGILHLVPIRALVLNKVYTQVVGVCMLEMLVDSEEAEGKGGWQIMCTGMSQRAVCRSGQPALIVGYAFVPAQSFLHPPCMLLLPGLATVESHGAQLANGGECVQSMSTYLRVRKNTDRCLHG